MRFVPLDRRFIRRGVVHGGHDPAERARWAEALGKAETWEDILAPRVAVVLGEAGAGKSREFEHRCAEIAAQGTPAFKLTLLDLVKEGVEGSLAHEDLARLVQWREGDGVAYFFLDELDEAKLARETLLRALTRLGRALGEETGRAHVVISCRGTDWDTDRDTTAVEAFARGTVPLYELAALDDGQVGKLATEVGVSDVDAFLRAVAAADAGSFVARPQDAIGLAEYWRDEERLGTLTEIVERDVERRLREDPHRRSSLVDRRVREGAEQLAIALVLTGRREIRQADAGESLDPVRVLADWNEGDRQLLLSRAVFDAGTHGRVRMHHRIVQEYLAARWLHRASETGLSAHEIERLMLRRVDQKLVVPQHLAATAGWLARWNDELRSRLVTEAPEVLMGFGDPSAIPAPVRRAVLRSYAAKFMADGGAFRSFDRAALGRFADEGLCETLNELIGDPNTPSELVRVLLEVVAEGAFVDCGETALARALDPSGSTRLRCVGIRAAVAAWPMDDHAQLIQRLESGGVSDADVAGVLLVRLGDEMSVGQILRIVQKTEVEEAYSGLQHILGHELPRRWESDRRAELLEGLVGLATEERTNATEPVHSQRTWIVTVLASVVTCVIDLDPDDLEPILRAIDTLVSTARHAWSVVSISGLTERLETAPRLRRELFWRHAEAVADREGKFPRSVRHHFDLWRLEETDASWLEEDALSRLEVRERVLAFNTLAKLYFEDGHSVRDDRLQRLAQADSALARRLERIRNPPLSKTYSLLPPNGMVLRQKAKALKDNQRRSVRLDALVEAIDEVRAGEMGPILQALLFATGGSCPEKVDPERLASALGDPLADATRSGLCHCWESYDPPLEHVLERPGSWPIAAWIGRVGIAFAFDSGEIYAGTLNPERGADAILITQRSEPPWMRRLDTLPRPRASGPTQGERGWRSRRGGPGPPTPCPDAWSEAA